MSLINEALKKAQRLQSHQPAGPAPVLEGRPPATGGRPVIIRRGPPMGYEKMLLGVVVLAVVIIGGVTIAMLLLRDREKPGVAAAPSAPSAVQPIATPVTSEPTTATIATPSLAPAPTPSTFSTTPPAVTQSVATPAVAPPPAAQQPEVASVPAQPAPSPPPRRSDEVVTIPAASTPASSPAATEPGPVRPAIVAPVAPQPAAPASPPRQNSKILELIGGFQITGVRAAGEDSKVLMNNRLYRLNDIVDYELGLRLTGITTSFLTFTDENGVMYRKIL